MKNRHTFYSLLVTGLTGTIFAACSNVVLPESLRADKIMAGAYSLGLILFTVSDYARRPRALRIKPAMAPLLRPAYPVLLEARPQNGQPREPAPEVHHAAA